MAITPLPAAPSTANPANFAARADAWIAALATFVTEANALAAALNLNSTTDTSSSSVLIGLGAKTFTVSAGKSFQPGMFLIIADTSAPTTNSMYGQVSSYSGTTLVMNMLAITDGTGSPTSPIAAWTISQSAGGGAYAGLAATAITAATSTNQSGGTINATTSEFSGLMSLNGGQIKFPSTPNASADIHTLDDYAEYVESVGGGWNPISIGATTALSNGTGIKIGRNVNIYIRLANGATPYNIFAGGTIDLPWAAAQATQVIVRYPDGTFGTITISGTTATWSTAYAAPANTTLYFQFSYAA